MPQYLRLDLFPATVTLPDGEQLRSVRAVVTEDTLYVFQDWSPTPRAVLIEPLYDYSRLGRTRFQAVTDETQDTILIEKQAGCGCGNKLKGFRPFPGVPLDRNS